MSQEATDEEIKAAYKRLSKKVNSIVSNSNINSLWFVLIIRETLINKMICFSKVMNIYIVLPVRYVYHSGVRTCPFYMSLLT